MNPHHHKRRTPIQAVPTIGTERQRTKVGDQLLGTEGASWEIAAIDDLLMALGTPEFSDVMLQLAQALSHADFFSAYQMQGNRPVCIALSSASDQAAVNSASQKYLSNYWQSDLVWRTSNGIHRIRAREIADRDYRRECFDEFDVLEKMSIVRPRGSLVTCVNIFRHGRSGPFGSADAERYRQLGNLIATAAHRHASFVKVGRGGTRLIDKKDAVTLINRTFPRLSAREREVCARIVAGMTSEAIALDLSLAYSSVLTYRKRAYARLGISSQAELFGLCLGSASSAE